MVVHTSSEAPRLPEASALILARSRHILATATFRTPGLHRGDARPVQGVLSRLITRTRISSDREGCRVGVAQLDCARLYSDDDSNQLNATRRYSLRSAALPALRARSIHKSACSRNSCGVNTIHSKLSNKTRRPIVGGRYETYLRAMFGVPFKKNANAVFPSSLEAVCTVGWPRYAANRNPPAVMPARNTPTNASIISPSRREGG